MKILLLILFLSVSCSAQTIRYVSAGSGNDSWTGVTSTSAWATLNKTQDGANGLSDGHNIIYVDEGTYNEGVALDTHDGTSEGARFEYIAAPEKWGNSGTPLVNGSGAYGGFYAQSQDISYITIQGFKITNTGGNYGIIWYGEGAERVDYWNIFDCEIYGAVHGVLPNENASYAKIFNCTIYNFVGDGIRLGATTGDTDNRAYNCVINNCADTVDAEGGIRTPVATQYIYNCIISSCATLLYADNAAYIVSNYNCLDLGGGVNYGRDESGLYTTMAAWQATGQDVNSIAQDPGFRDASIRAFQVTPLSPLIDAGTILGDVLTDVNGIPRPKNYRYDIGVYEYDKINVISD